jgi:hypothetical protein
MYIVGDIHGQFERLVELLTDEGLLASDLSWTGGEAELLFVGDFVDRGPDGLRAVELAMRLEREAVLAGGRVTALIGNHELLMLAAHKFPAYQTEFGETLLEWWQLNGGESRDLDRLEARHIDWFQRLPAMRLERQTLFLHADAELYLNYGQTVEEVNASFGRILSDAGPAELNELLEVFSEHGGFEGGGKRLAERYLQQYGGKRLLHGHTPIDKFSLLKPGDVHEARIYHGGMCINVDGGMYRGGPGFVFELS